MSLTKISVAHDPWAPLGRPWLAHCPYCGVIGEHSVSWDGAMWEAEQHADDPCDGIRLALLLERLKMLQDSWYLTAAKYSSDADRDGITALAFREYTCRESECVKSARELGRLIAKATR